MTRSFKHPGRPRLSDVTEPTSRVITRAAARLFMDHGYSAVSMSMIAKEANLTKASVYYHFKDKATLFTAAMKYILDQAYQATEQILASPVNVRGKLERITRIVADFPQPFWVYDTMMHEASTELAREQEQEIRQAEKRLYTHIEKMFTEAVRNKEIRQLDPFLLTHVFVNILRVVQLSSTHERIKDKDALAKQLIGIFWEGVGLN